MKIFKSFIALLGMIAIAASLASCADWGKMDPEPGTDVYPTRQKMTSYAFSESTDLSELSYVLDYPDAGAEIVDDDSLYKKSLHLDEAKVTLANPFVDVNLQNGAGFTFWLRAPEGQEESQVLSLPTGESLLPESGIQGLEDGRPHFVGVQIKTGGFVVYLDGEAQSSTIAENEGLIKALNSADGIILGNSEGEYFITDITFVRNQMTEKDLERPAIKKGKIKLPDPVYFNDFNSGAGDATVVGGGSFRSDEAPGFKKVFQNVTGGMRQNYLLLPSDALSHSATTQKMTIGVWVNSVNAGASGDYMWAPLFMAYTAAPVNNENTLPMFACQYRGVLQVNNNGWTDYTDAQNVAGVNTLYHGDTDWLADKGWHYYTAVFDGENAKVYFDGVLANEWNMDGTTNTQMGLFTNGADLKYICLGGNQAWNWGDNDPGFAFDDIVIYDDALSAAQIGQIIEDKPNSGGGGVDLPTPVFSADFNSLTGMEIIGEGTIATDADSHFGKYFQNKAGAKATNYLLLPADALSHSAETKEMSIAFWVNAANAGETSAYTYSPFFTAYANAPAGDNGAPMLALQSRGNVQVNCSGWCDFTGANHVDGKNNIYNSNAWEAGDAAYNFVTNWLEDKAWHYYVVTFTTSEVIQYMDGIITNHWKIDNTSEGQIVGGLFSNGSDLKYICVGGNQAWNWNDPDGGFGYDDVNIYDKALTETDIKNIMDVKMGNVPVSGPTPYYKNTFDDMKGAEIIGGGSITEDPVHGKIFQNVTGGMRKNYLLLPEDLLSHSAESHQFSMSVWVNSANAGASSDYMWAPLFTAYTAAPVNNENTLPMFACQYRGVLQINNNGWTDYTDVQNVAGANTLYHDATDWLADKEWHLYTVVFDGENAKVYFDGLVANEWNMDGTTNTQSGLYTNGADLKYICLGGNQAWNWADNDPGFAFDDIQFFDFALSESDIEALMNQY